MTIRLFRSRAIVMAATMLAAPLAVSSMLATPAHAAFVAELEGRRRELIAAAG